MKLGEILQKTTEFFKEKKIESARLDAELLIADVLKIPRIQVYIRFEYPLTETEIQKCRDYVRRRSQGEPVAYILERKDFYDSTYKVRKGVLIPRPETEGLVEEVLKWSVQPLTIADFGCGSGCIGLSLLKARKGSKLLGIDASPVAIEVSKENALPESDFACARVQDFDFGERKFDVVVANPPYISKDDQNVQASVRAFEPYEALFADEDGYREIRDWAVVTAKVLRPGGFAAFEIGSQQAEKSKQLFADTGQFTLIRSAKDLAGLDRFIFAEKV